VTSTIPIIQIKNLVAKYGDTEVLHSLNVDIKHGDIFFILGKSGCGKTTLFNHLIGLLTPTSGEILIDNQNFATANDKERLNILRKIGVMFQSGALFGSMNLLENVCLPLEEFTRLPKEAILQIASDKLALVGLEAFCDYMPSEISGGMQKRAAIARAMALDPKILFLDEPSAGLDPITSKQIDDLILFLWKTLGMTFVIVSHELSSIFHIATHAILLHEGNIVANGKPKTIAEQSDNLFVKAFFEGKGDLRNGE